MAFTIAQMGILEFCTFYGNVRCAIYVGQAKDVHGKKSREAQGLHGMVRKNPERTAELNVEPCPARAAETPSLAECIQRSPTLITPGPPPCLNSGLLLGTCTAMGHLGQDEQPEDDGAATLYE